MRRLLSFVICIVMMLCFAGCKADDADIFLSSGNYYAVGDYEEMLTPYIYLDIETSTFSFGAGSVVSFAENGTYKIAENKIIATSQSTTYIFEIKDSETLVLVDNGNHKFFKIERNTLFLYSEDLK